MPLSLSKGLFNVDIHCFVSYFQDIRGLLYVIFVFRQIEGISYKYVHICFITFAWLPV